MTSVVTRVEAALVGLVSQGGPAAQRLVEEVRPQPLGFRVSLTGEGGGELFVVIGDGAVTVSGKRPEGDLAASLEVSAALAQWVLDQGPPARAKRPPERGALRAKEIVAWLRGLQTRSFMFRFVVPDSPFGTRVEIECASGAYRAGGRPNFTVTVRHADLERVRTGAMSPTELFFGRLTIEGDSALAMALALEVAGLNA